MEQIYNDAKNPGGLGRVSRLAKSARVTNEEARKCLQERYERTVNKERRKKSQRNKIIVANLQQQLQVDLAHLCIDYEGYKYLLVAIHCFSRLDSFHPLKKIRNGSCQSADSRPQVTARTRQNAIR